MIRVLQIVTSMEVGGIEVLLMNLYRHMDRTQVQFDFLLHRPQETYFEKEILSLGGRIFRVPPINPLRHRAYLKALDEFFMGHSEHKIVHAHNNAFSMYVLRAAKKASVPVCIAHSHISDVSIAWLKRFFYNYCRKRINNYADFRVACSNKAGEWLYGKSIIGGKQFHILHNSIEYDKFSYSDAARDEMRTSLGVESKIVIGHVGRFNNQKNHSFILKIFKEIIRIYPDALLLLIGEGKLREKVERQAQLLKLEHSVRFLGIRSDVSQLMQAMDIFVIPSLFEGFPVTLVEAQAAGLPCVVSDTVSSEVAITSLVEFVSLSKSPQEWAEVVLEKANTTERRDYSEEVKKAGYDAVENAKWLQEFYLARHREALERKR